MHLCSEKKKKRSQITNMYLGIYNSFHLNMPEKEFENLNFRRTKSAVYHHSTEQLIIIFTSALRGYLFLRWLIVECTSVTMILIYRFLLN